MKYKYSVPVHIYSDYSVKWFLHNFAIFTKENDQQMYCFNNGENNFLFQYILEPALSYVYLS